MTELERHTDNTPDREVEYRNADPATSLAVWAEGARHAAQIATSLAKTSFVPASLRNKPEDITAAILTGQELGLRPMASLRSMDVIQGTPALRAHAMRGLVQSKGHSVQLVESTNDRCVMRGRRRGETDWQTVEWDMARARDLGLTGKSEWKKQPRTMLVARATGEICRLVAADALYAMPYAAEELDEWSSRPAAPTPLRPVTTAEITGPSAANQAPPPDAPPADEEAPPPPGALSNTQRSRMFAQLDDLGYRDRDVRLRIAGRMVGRTLWSLNDLSADEADQVAHELAFFIEAGPDGAAQLAALAAHDQEQTT